MVAESEGAACDGQKEDGDTELLGTAGDEEGVIRSSRRSGDGCEQALPGDGMGLRRLPEGEGGDKKHLLPFDSFRGVSIVRLADFLTSFSTD